MHETIQEYSDDNIENTTDPEIKLKIDDSLFLETFLMKVRGKSISFSSFLKKKINDKTCKLEFQIKNCEDAIRKNFQSIDEPTLSELSKLKIELQQIKEEELRGTLLRNRVLWYEEGKKPTKYFCHLENRNYVSKSINKIITDKNEEISDGDQILLELRNFYKNLYALNKKQENNGNLQNLITPMLSEQMRDNLEKEIEEKEISLAVKSMKNNKSPGLDGFPIDFFKYFWKDLKFWIFRFIKEVFETNKMSLTMKRGVIT